MATTSVPENIDTDVLRSLLDGRWAHIRQMARQSLRGELFAPVHGLTVEEHRERVARQLREIAATEVPRLGFSTAHGGAEDVGGSVVAFEMLVCDLSLMVKVGVQWGLFGGAIQALGTERHHAAYLPAVMSLELPGCFAMTETGHGSDVQRLRTTATYDPATEEFVVHTPDPTARKDYIGNAARDGRVAVVFAQLVTAGERHGVHALLVPIRDEQGRPMPGVRIEDCGHKAGLNGVDNGRLEFDRVRVPRTALLDRYGRVAADGGYSSPIDNPRRRFFTMLGTLVRGRVSVAGGAGSAAKAALAIAVRHAESRRQFTRPGSAEEVRLLDYLAHQRRLLPALATTYALHFAQEELVGRLHDASVGEPTSERERRELESQAAGLKAVATWHASATIQACREACGGAGYLSENRLAQLRADTDVFTTFEGANTVLLQLVAKGLLTHYRDEFGSLDTLGTVRLLTGRFFEAVIERTAARTLVDRLVEAAPGRDEEADLYDRGWQYRLLEDRERHVLEGLARRLRRAGREGEDAFEVFNNAQDHVLRAARVHVERTVLEAFIAGVDRCADPDVRNLLERVCDLYALSTIEADRAWFLEHGRLTPARSKAVTAAVNALCGSLRPHARALVDGFGLEQEWLAAPIAGGPGEGTAVGAAVS
ncbi:acyl-CoA dehydrogenase [Marinactinospora thermotolerans]|uniref:acyl-CoA oxidase n=1 Tax=Marinactinospora thermotolerans DSM 45154 TaxID=1122192 RepID=A0A1T4RKW4_9ACTN|nr:acyl-CoA dehydrogenase [Marinactinospora thermotolerans]SKA16622.1 Acyl-coenzyme A oxidase [Marinactinospora thermotolerans DSM 45154]